MKVAESVTGREQPNHSEREGGELVEVTIQGAQVSTEPVGDLVVLRVLDEQFRWNVCLTEEQVAELVTELMLLRVAA